jgi:hypothetical protein
MSSAPLKCMIILSSKSSGSTALQTLLVNLPQVNHILKTEHRANETLYWTKSASILGLPQVDMLDSVVPLNYEKARASLISFLSDNLDYYTPPDDNDEQLIFGGWQLLCKKYAPVFLEKSPHHLHQWSALELIAEAIERFQEVDFLLVGLVRNPMDTLYSMWRRWRSIPEKNQYEWLLAYSNLLRYRDLVAERLIMVRYEDIVDDISCLNEILAFIGVTEKQVDKNYFHSKSKGKWKKDRSYGFKLSDEVATLAEKYGFRREDMTNDGNSFWFINRDLSRSIYRNTRRIRSTLSTLNRKSYLNSG